MAQRDFMLTGSGAVGANKDMMGHPYWFHRQPDCRQLCKA